MKHLRLILLLLICAALFSTSAVPASAVGGYIRGDADGDAVVVISDATVIQLHLADIAVPYINETAADVDDNGLDISDVTKIQRYLADMNDPFHIGEYVSEKAPSDYDEYELPVV